MTLYKYTRISNIRIWRKFEGPYISDISYVIDCILVWRWNEEEEEKYRTKHIKFLYSQTPPCPRLTGIKWPLVLLDWCWDWWSVLLDCSTTGGRLKVSGATHTAHIEYYQVVLKMTSQTCTVMVNVLVNKVFLWPRSRRGLSLAMSTDHSHVRCPFLCFITYFCFTGWNLIASSSMRTNSFFLILQCSR